VADADGESLIRTPLAELAGQLNPEDIWKEWAEGFPQGLPEPGDRGLDNTHTWGRTYWGGTMFWLLADLRIRDQTQNHKSVDDVVRTILSTGGDGSQHWDIARVLEVGDRATGTQVLHELHAELGGAPATPNLADLWARLGVRYTRRHVTFDDAAPWAHLRNAITPSHR